MSEIARRHWNRAEVGLSLASIPPTLLADASDADIHPISHAHILLRVQM
jgi:hypothetical protein